MKFNFGLGSSCIKAARRNKRGAMTDFVIKRAHPTEGGFLGRSPQCDANEMDCIAFVIGNLPVYWATRYIYDI